MFWLIDWLIQNRPNSLSNQSVVLQFGLYFGIWCVLQLGAAVLLYIPLRRKTKPWTVLAGVVLLDLVTAPAILYGLHPDFFNRAPWWWTLAPYGVSCALVGILLLPVHLPSFLPLRGRWLRLFLTLMSVPALALLHPWGFIVWIDRGRVLASRAWYEWIPLLAAVGVTGVYLWLVGSLLVQQRTLDRRKMVFKAL